MKLGINMFYNYNYNIVTGWSNLNNSFYNSIVVHEINKSLNDNNNRIKHLILIYFNTTISWCSGKAINPRPFSFYFIYPIK